MQLHERTKKKSLWNPYTGAFASYTDHHPGFGTEFSNGTPSY
jgi:hypothetical protein